MYNGIFNDEYLVERQNNFASAIFASYDFKDIKGTYSSDLLCGPRPHLSLIYAVNSDRLEIVEWLINLGADVNGIDRDQTALRVAARGDNHTNSIAIYDLLVKKGADTQFRTNSGSTGLHICTCTTFSRVLKDHDINVVDNAGNTPLHFAYENENHKKISLLLKNNASQDIKNHQDITPNEINAKNLLIDLLTTDPDVFKIEEIINTQLHSKKSKEIACREAVFRTLEGISHPYNNLPPEKEFDRQLEILTLLVTLLVKNDGNLNIYNRHNRTPLSVAILHKKNALKLVKWLVANGADIYQFCSDPTIHSINTLETPLGLACLTKLYDVVLYLLEKGARPRQNGPQYYSDFYKLINSGDYVSRNEIASRYSPELVKTCIALLKTGADLYQKNKFNDSDLGSLLFNCSQDEILKILSAAEDFHFNSTEDDKDSIEMGPSHAIVHEHLWKITPSLFRFFISRGLKINTPDKKGKPFLQNYLNSRNAIPSEIDSYIRLGAKLFPENKKLDEKGMLFLSNLKPNEHKDLLMDRNCDFSLIFALVDVMKNLDNHSNENEIEACEYVTLIKTFYQFPEHIQLQIIEYMTMAPILNIKTNQYSASPIRAGLVYKNLVERENWYIPRNQFQSKISGIIIKKINDTFLKSVAKLDSLKLITKLESLKQEVLNATIQTNSDTESLKNIAPHILLMTTFKKEFKTALQDISKDQISSICEKLASDLDHKDNFKLLTAILYVIPKEKLSNETYKKLACHEQTRLIKHHTTDIKKELREIINKDVLPTLSEHQQGSFHHRKGAKIINTLGFDDPNCALAAIAHDTRDSNSQEKTITQTVKKFKKYAHKYYPELYPISKLNLFNPKTWEINKETNWLHPQNKENRQDSESFWQQYKSSAISLNK